MATRAALKKPRLGRKEVFLPNFTLTLLRTPDLPPTFASFYVPLNLNKLDLRDYLWNCYGVSALSVRSYVQLQKLKQGKGPRQVPRQWFRPRSIKKMTVEMERPFVWPEVPDLEMWDKSVYEGTEKERDEHQKYMAPDSSKLSPADRNSIAKQAKSLLQSTAAWKTGNTNPKWEDVGEEVEVETDVELPKSGQ